jgi:hypothetical protein
MLAIITWLSYKFEVNQIYNSEEIIKTLNKMDYSLSYSWRIVAVKKELSILSESTLLIEDIHSGIYRITCIFSYIHQYSVISV